MELDQNTITTAVDIFDEYVKHDDETIYCLLEDAGIEPRMCNRLIQFIPMVFTRFIFQSRGVQFASEYRTMDHAGEVSEPKLLADNPAFQAVWEYCESQSADTWLNESTRLNAARSIGFQSLQQADANGMPLHQIVVDQPILME